MAKKATGMTSSITRRWLRGGLLITMVLVILAEALFLYSTYEDLYGGVQQAILSRFSTIEGQLRATGSAGEASEVSASRSQALRRTVEQFDEKDKFEFMLLDPSGAVLTTASGTFSQELMAGTDVYEAMTGASGSGISTFRTSGGERVMAITVLVPYAADGITAMRLVTSLTLVDRQMMQFTLISVGIAAVVLGVALWSGLFFIRSIVLPLGRVEALATRIAAGDLTVRLPDNRYNDEIGRLCATINQMAGALAETERMKNDFISSVSHELRTPLTSIKGWVETITARGGGDPEIARRGMAIISAETDRLYAMVEDLLDFSRLQNGVKLDCQVLDLVAEATDAALFVEPRMQKENLRLIYEEPPEPYPVWADPARLRQVFVNILDNAIKYSRPGGSVTLLLSRTASTVTAAVRDEGKGIAPEDLDKVRLKFFKGKNAVRGSGIGLAVVDEIVTALGGTLDIQSTLGEGTTVSVTLPVYHAGQEHLHDPLELPGQPAPGSTPNS
ncbi:HAMP domain-containing sensor histidine kinase [uncultured Gemmiger sp.]|uniref:sensor histidine kinase n=1 Tax=uncultured Gemmiger sp. TaxID=1623490 RepID=UPI0025D7AF0B|nr:HAMP domain-containing sensor histidine kinase [uncultured Gemmiger sp.]